MKKHDQKKTHNKQKTLQEFLRKNFNKVAAWKPVVIFPDIDKE